jgi:hypothetical protein
MAFSVRQKPGDDGPSRLPADQHRGHSRRVALGWLCSLQAASSMIAAAITYAHSPHDWIVLAGLVQYDEIGVMLANILHAAVIFTAVIIVLSYSDAAHLVVTGGVALLLVLFILDGSDPSSRFPAFAYLLVVCLAIIALQPTIEDLKVIGGIGVALALIAVLFALFLPQYAYMPDGWNQKFLPGMPALAGPLNHSNSLGVFLALSAPFIHFFARNWIRWASLVLVVGVVVMSASRTALLALGAALVVFLLCKLWPEMSRLTAGLSFAVAGACVVTVPLMTQDADAYSGRGVVWAWALGQFHKVRQFVWGVSAAWPGHPTRQGSEGAPAFSAHNLFVQWLFVGGLALIVLGIAVFAAYAVRVARMSPGTVPFIASSYLVILLASSVFEFIVVLTPGSPFFMTTVVPLVSVLGHHNTLQRAPSGVRTYAKLRFSDND